MTFPTKNLTKQSYLRSMLTLTPTIHIVCVLTFEIELLKNLQCSMFTCHVECISNHQPGWAWMLCQQMLTVFLPMLGDIIILSLYDTLLGVWDVKEGRHTTKYIQVRDSLQEIG